MYACVSMNVCVYGYLCYGWYTCVCICECIHMWYVCMCVHMHTCLHMHVCFSFLHFLMSEPSFRELPDVLLHASVHICICMSV